MLSNFSPHQQFGFRVEEWVADQLAGRGFQVRPITRFMASGDLMVDSLQVPVMVEVKAANPTWAIFGKQRYPVWMFNIRRLANIDHLFVLVCLGENGESWPFVIPSWCFFGRGQIPRITSQPGKYRGWMAPYLNNWEIIGQVAAQRQKHTPQLALWGGQHVA